MLISAVVTSTVSTCVRQQQVLRTTLRRRDVKNTVVSVEILQQQQQVLTHLSRMGFPIFNIWACSILF